MLPKPHPAAAVAALLIAVAAMPQTSARAQSAASDACLARPTVTCSVDLALTASAASHEDYERARLVLQTGERLKDLAARKLWLDRMARFFNDATTGQAMLDRARRVTDIATAIVAGDTATADRLLGETNTGFQRWWDTLAAVLRTLTEAGKPDLAVAFEAAHRRTVSVSKTDALGRQLGKEVWDTRQPLARALVRCACGPDPLPLALALPKQNDRVGLGLVLHARRHDVDGLHALLTREFGQLANIKDRTQRDWIGYGFGLLMRELPARDIPAALRKAPAWLTAEYFERPADFGMPGPANLYGRVLARAVEAGDRKAVTALVRLRPRGDTVWLLGATIAPLDAAAKVADLLPKPERDHLHMLKIGAMLARGDAREGVKAAMKTPAARRWLKPELDNEDAAAFEEIVLAPLLARGAFDVAEDAVGQLHDAEARKAMQESIAAAKTEQASGTGPKTAAAILSTRWDAYQKAKGDPAAGRAFLFAVRDLIAAQPDALPFE
jgi:hypothetical protein